MLSQLRLKVKLIVGFLALGTIVLVLGILGIRGEFTMNEYLIGLSQDSMPAIEHLSLLNQERLEIRSHAYEVKSLRHQDSKRLEEIQRERTASLRVIDETLGKLERFLHSPEEQAVFNALKADYAHWSESQAKLGRLIESMQTSADQKQYTDTLSSFTSTMDENFLLSDRVGVLIESLVALKNKQTADILTEANRSSKNFISIFGTGIGVGLVLALLLGWAITRDTLSQLGGEPAQVVAVVNQLAEGDLTTYIPLRPGDETSLMAAMARMVESMRRVLRDVSSASSQVAAAAVELSATSEETNRQVRVEQSETDQVATAMNQMTATVEEVARHAAAAARAAQETDRETEAGSQVVAQTISAIDLLAQEVESASQVIARLSEDSTEIGAVLDVIRGVAEQTNLLALNAAIEAARAGEQGRGFAVVAAEVRTLASRTQSSIQDIQEKIERVQKGSAGAVAVMTKGQEMARESVVQAQRAGESLQAISAAITSIADMNRQIASAAEEQTAVAEEINRNIHTISATVDQTAAGAAHIASASEELARLASLLQERVACFRL